MAVVLYSGNVGIGQDLGTVLRAVAGLNGDGGMTVRIVGGGKALPQFQSLAAELGLANVEFAPPVPLYQLPDLLAGGDIHLICQKPGTEGLLVPSKLYSTLAAARPSIFIGPGDCEVGRILLASGSGFVVEPGDVGKAMDALRYLVGSAPLREAMGRKGREYYETHFGRDKSVSRIVDILEVAGNGKGNGAHGKRPVVRRRRRRSWFTVPFERRRLALAAVGTLVVLALTHLPGAMMPSWLGGYHLDKVQHFAAYGAIAFLFITSFRRPPGVRAMAVILALGALVGAADELTQPFVRRTASPFDWAADVAGIAAVCLVLLAVRRLRRGKRLRSALPASHGRLTAAFDGKRSVSRTRAWE